MTTHKKCKNWEWSDSDYQYTYESNKIMKDILNDLIREFYPNGFYMETGSLLDWYEFGVEKIIKEHQRQNENKLENKIKNLWQKIQKIMRW